MRARLAQQHVAPLRLESGQARSLPPTDIELAAHNPGAARAAGTGGAFVGKANSLAQASTQNGFAMLAFKGEFTVFALNGDLHLCRDGQP